MKMIVGCLYISIFFLFSQLRCSFIAIITRTLAGESRNTGTRRGKSRKHNWYRYWISL